MRRFDVALSFPGERRELVERVAELLAQRFGRGRVLYDGFCQAEFARPDLKIYLPPLYRKESELIVVFLCPDYKRKKWCRLEWRHISELIGDVEQHRIMFLRDGFSDDMEELILDGDGAIDFSKSTAEDIEKWVCDRFVINGGVLPDSSKNNTEIARNYFKGKDSSWRSILLVRVVMRIFPLALSDMKDCDQQYIEKRRGFIFQCINILWDEFVFQTNAGFFLANESVSERAYREADTMLYLAKAHKGLVQLALEVRAPVAKAAIHCIAFALMATSNADPYAAAVIDVAADAAALAAVSDISFNVASVAQAASTSTWAAFFADADCLDSYKRVDDLVSCPVWKIEVPNWSNIHWNIVKDILDA